MGPCDHRTAPLVPRRPATRVCECRSGTHVPAIRIRPTRSGRATRRRALACEVGGAWDARPTRELSPRFAGAGVAGVVLLFENWLFVVRHSSGTARTEALLAAFTRRRVDRDRRGDALAHARRRRAAHAWVALAAAPQPGHRAPRLSSPRPLLSSRRRSSSSSRVFSSVAAPC